MNVGTEIAIPCIAGSNKKTTVWYILGTVVNNIIIDGNNYVKIIDGATEYLMPIGGRGEIREDI